MARSPPKSKQDSRYCLTCAEYRVGAGRGLCNAQPVWQCAVSDRVEAHPVSSAAALVSSDREIMENCFTHSLFNVSNMLSFEVTEWTPRSR